MTNTFPIGRHIVGEGQPTYFVADVAANHDGDIERAKELIWLGAEAGVDAAKFQNFTADTLVSDFGFRSLGEQVSHQAAWKTSVFEVYDAAALPLDWTETLRDTCDAAGIDYFTSLYNPAMLELLSPHCAAWKIGSGDITWHDIIASCAADNKPVLLATGASDMDEVAAAMGVAQAHSDQIVLMQCNTNYTGSADNFVHIQLRVLQTFAELYPDVVLGLSDHTPGHATVLGSVALGAKVIEKHFTDDNSRDGSDHPFSMNPTAWREMVDRTRELEVALGTTEKRVMDNERDTIVVQRRSVRAARNIAAGETLTADDMVVLRPCPPDALPPYRMGELIGKTCARDIPNGDCVRHEDTQ
jgi:sialic acid synthase SpsE